MNYQTAVKVWRIDYAQAIKRGDKGELRMLWSVYIDWLHREGLITDRQAQTWGQPKECK